MFRVLLLGLRVEDQVFTFYSAGLRVWNLQETARVESGVMATPRISFSLACEPHLHLLSNLYIKSCE